MAFIKKRIDDEQLFSYDRREIVLAPMWSNNTSSLSAAFTSSRQPHHQKIYYRNVFSDITKTGSQDVDFSISYGNIFNSGSSTGSFGILTGSLSSSGVIILNPVSESQAIYSSYRNMLIDTVNNKNNYLSNGRFKFYGLRDSNFGIYEWGFVTQSLSTVLPIDETEKIDIPDANAFSLRQILSLSNRRNENTTLPANRIYFFINKQNRIFMRAESNLSRNGPVSSILKEFGLNKSWKEVASGRNHVIAIDNDGALWGWGDNEYGQLGLGYTYSIGNAGVIETYFENINQKDPVQIGTANNWQKVYAGPFCSYAINTEGELYVWGWDSNSAILGTGARNVEYFSPKKIESNTWRSISIGSTLANDDTFITVFGIDTSGRLWGWGDNTAFIGTRTKLSTANDYELSPILLSSDTDWVDVSCGRSFVIALKGNPALIYGWGYSGVEGEQLASDQNDTTLNTHYTFANRKNLINLTTNPEYTNWYSDWKEVSCGTNFSCAVSTDRKLWTWGDNANGQLYWDTTVGGTFPLDTFITFFVTSSNVTGWDKIECGQINSIGAINYPDANVFSMTSEDIYVLNIERSNFKDKIDAGNWQLGLRTVTTGSGQQMLPGSIANASNLITLVDDSINLDGTDYQHPMYDVTSKGGEVYGIYSGSIARGIDKSAKNSPYGLFFPENGIIILNGEMLRNTGSRNTIQIQTRRTPATSSGAFPTSSNADLLYTSISGAMSAGVPFIANAVEVKHPTYIFARINSEEYNYTLNRTYYSDPGTYIVKDKLQTIGYPFTYITTIGLYNDDDDLLAVAKLSRPILKTPSTELVVKIKLDI